MFDVSDIWNNVGQILSGVVIGIGAILFAQLKTWIQKKTVGSSVSDSLSIKLLLAEIRSYYDADRVKLYQFHNGEFYTSGGSIQKLSLTHFVMARGVSLPIGADTTQQNIPIGYVAQTTDAVLKSNHVFISACDMTEDSYFKGILRHSGSRCALLRGIFNSKHDMMGVLVITWFDEVTLTEDQLKIVRMFGTQISDELLLGAKK